MQLFRSHSLIGDDHVNWVGATPNILIVYVPQTLYFDASAFVRNKARDANNLARGLGTSIEEEGERARERTKGRIFLIYFQHNIAETLFTLYKGC